MGQNTNGGGYYNNGYIGHSGTFVPVSRPKKEHEDDYEGEGDMESMVEEERREIRSSSHHPLEEEEEEYEVGGGPRSLSQGEGEGRTEKEMVPATPYGAGDIVGVLVDLKTSKRRMGFFVNGDFQGFHYSNLPTGVTFYPAVSLKSYGCKVMAHPLLTHRSHFAIDGEDADNVSD